MLKLFVYGYRDRNFTRAKMKRRIAEADATIEHYLQQLADADRLEPAEDKTRSLEDKIASQEVKDHARPKIDAKDVPFDPLEYIEHLDQIPFDPDMDPSLGN